MGRLLLPTHRDSLEVDWDDPLNKGLVAWWPMRKSTGTGLLRDIAGGHSGTLNGSMTHDDWVVNSETKSLALDLDGTDDYVSADGYLPNHVTIAGWFNPATAMNSRRGMVQLGTHVGGNAGFRAGAFGSNYITFYLNGVGFIETTYTWTVNKWVFWVGTWDGASLQIYEDGLLFNSKAESGSPSWTGDALIGYYTTGTDYYWDGQISDVRIYNRALNASEVQALYQASRRDYPTQFKRRRVIYSSPVAAPAARNKSNLLLLGVS